MSHVLFPFIVATACACIVRTIAPAVPSDIRWRAVAAITATALLIVVEGVAVGPLAGSPAVSRSLGMLVIALVGGLSWRIPDRMQSWATAAGEHGMLLLAVGGAALDGPVAGVSTAGASAGCIAWAVAGIVTRRTTASPSRRRAAGPVLGLGVLVAVSTLHVASPAMAAVVASVTATIGLALEHPPDLAALGRGLGRATLGAAAVLAAMGLVGLPLDARASFPTLVGALLLHGSARARASAAAAEPGLEPLATERETLAVLGRLTDPQDPTAEPSMQALEHLLPGGRIELRYAPDAPQHGGKRIDVALLTEVRRRGVLRSDAAPTLPAAAAGALRALGPDVVLLPVGYEDRLHGVLLVRGLQQRDGMLPQARRFADLLGHRLEARRLFTELEHKQRLATLGSFAAALIHDLRSPLATVRLNVQLAQRTTAPHERETLADAIRALDRVLDDLSGTLDFTRPLALEVAPLDLATLAREVVDSQRLTAERRSVTLRGPAVGGEPAQVRGDRPRLVRALENLLRNALEVSPPGSTVAIEISVHPDGVELAVTDQGPGIDPSLGDRVFEPFVTTKRDGVGLGLAIVRKIVEAHRGRIGLRSVRDRGACVTLWMPRVSL